MNIKTYGGTDGPSCLEVFTNIAPMDTLWKTNMRKRPSDSLCNLKYIYICIFYSFSKIHYIFLTKHIHQDFLELQKKPFLFLTFFKIHSIIFYQLQNFDMECFPSAIYHTIFRSSNVGAKRSGGEARAGSVSHHCISALIRC